MASFWCSLALPGAPWRSLALPLVFFGAPWCILARLVAPWRFQALPGSSLRLVALRAFACCVLLFFFLTRRKRRVFGKSSGKVGSSYGRLWILRTIYVCTYVCMYVFLFMGEDCDGYWQCDVVSPGCFYRSSLFMVVDLAPCSGCRGTLPD